MKVTKGLILLISLLITSTLLASTKTTGIISGQIFSNEKDTICFATVYMKETTYGTATDINGCFQLEIPEGQYTMVMSAIGYKTLEQKVHIKKGQPIKSPYTLQAEHQQLDEVTVVSKGIHRVRRSAYNAIAIDMDALQNSSSNLSEALNKAPGIRLRESGGVGSENQLTLDGFTGKHVKVFIDGVPQEGVGSSFNVNNLPISFAERIEVYKGVVPIGFGTDALGGVINIVTNKKKRRWFLDSSYSYGSFNTHKSHVHFGQTFKNGLTYEINAFQNYSDNSYYVDNAVKDFTTGATDNSIIEHVKRFHDTYHNEAVIGKFGFTDTQWADRFMLTFTFSNMYQDIQTGDSQTDGKIFWGKTIVGVSTLLFMLSLLTGIFIWWPRNRKALGKNLCIKTRKGTRTFLYSLHVAGGMYAVLLLLAMGLTGLTWSFPWYRSAFYQLFGASATSQHHNQTNKKQRAKLETAHWEAVYQELWMRQPDCCHISIYNGYATVTKKAWGNQRASDRYDFRPDNGEIIQYTPYESTSRNSKLRGWIYSLHVGNWGGWFSKILTFLAALFGASLPLTGYYLWIKRLARN